MANGKFLSEDGRQQEQQMIQDNETERRWKILRAVACLVAWDIMLISMIMSGKIDTFYGVLFVAVFSAFFGRMTK